MKELVKPIKCEKEHNDAQMYCEGGNTGYSYCPTEVTCTGVTASGCSSWTLDQDGDDILF